LMPELRNSSSRQRTVAAMDVEFVCTEIGRVKLIAG
jgi:hypothetical protein